MNYKLIKNLLDVVKHFPDKKLAIKLHPVQSSSELQNIRELLYNSNQSSVEVFKDYPLNKLMNKCCVCFSEFSTTGLEAIMNGRLFIKTDYNLNGSYHPYNESGEIICTDNVDSTVKELKTLLSAKESYDTALSKEINFYKHFISVDGEEAAELMAKTIESEIKNNKS